MNLTQPLALGLVIGVVLWSAGAIVELFVTTFAVGPHGVAATVTIGLLSLLLLSAISSGARSRRWLRNPDSYW